MRITRYPSLTEPQFLGCVSAFVDSLTGELNSAVLSLRRLEGKGKGGAFAYEMTLDAHRYGALIVLDRWSTLVQAFGKHQNHAVLEGASERISTGESILVRANQLIDAAPAYTTEVVEVCDLAFRSLNTTFAPEAATAAQSAKLGPMLSDDYKHSRQIFLEDLAAR